MATPDVKLNILISGSGIAGPALAFWLYHLVPGAIITVLERSPAPRYGGQAVDLRGASVRVAERMGLLQAIKDKNTTEIGMQFVHADGKTKATFSMTGNVEQQSSEYRTTRSWQTQTDDENSDV
jgi:2-polyprenyl-6-methoxyphenol hydroxylase-like FAD-dependent oxidoreductase